MKKCGQSKMNLILGYLITHQHTLNPNMLSKRLMTTVVLFGFVCLSAKTYVPDLCMFIEYLIDNKVDLSIVNTINFVNPGALDTMQVVDLMTTYGIVNPKWVYVDPKLLNMAAPRSNCVLSINKLKCLFPDFHIQTEKEALDGALANIKLN